MADLTMNLTAVVQAIPIGRVYSDSNMKQIIRNSLYGATFEPVTDKRELRKRAHHVDSTIVQLVRGGVINKVDGGYLRGNDRQDGYQVTFIFDNQLITCSNLEQDEVVARMRAEMLNRSPQEHARRRIEALEQQLSELKEGMNNE